MHNLLNLYGKTKIITDSSHGLVFSYTEELTTAVIVFRNTLKNDHI